MFNYLYGLGPFIKDVISFSRFLTPSTNNAHFCQKENRKRRYIHNSYLQPCLHSTNTQNLEPLPRLITYFRYFMNDPLYVISVLMFFYRIEISLTRNQVLKLKTMLKSRYNNFNSTFLISQYKLQMCRNFSQF